MTEREYRLPSTTKKLKVPFQTDEINVYLTIAYKDNKPWEIFLNTKNLELYEYLATIGLLTSRLLQAGIVIDKIADDLNDIASPHTGHFRGQEWCRSVASLVGKTLKEHQHYEQAGDVSG